MNSSIDSNSTILANSLPDIDRATPDSLCTLLGGRFCCGERTAVLTLQDEWQLHFPSVVNGQSDGQLIIIPRIVIGDNQSMLVETIKHIKTESISL